MAGKRRLSLIVGVTLIMVLSQAVSAYFPSTRSVKLGLLAVKESDGKLVGEVIRALIQVSWPGSGGVVVYDVQGVGNSTVYSAMVGYYLASLLAGLDPHMYDVTISFETNERVSGPSASGFIAASLLDLLRGLTISDNVTMTGMLSPTGFILPVSGVPYKVKAAAKAGYNLVLVPIGNYEQLKAMLSKEDINVEPVCDVEEAAAILARVKWSPGSMLFNESEVLSLVKDRVSLFAHYAVKFAEAAEKLSKYLPANSSHVVKELVKLSRSLLDVDPYAAASLAFMASYMASSYAASHEGLKVVEEAFGTTLSDALAKARSIVENKLEQFKSLKKCGLWGFEALETAQLRLYFAERAAQEKDEAFKAVALIRALSAQSWGELADPRWGPLISCSLVKAYAWGALEYLNTSFHYLESILGKYVNLTQMAYGGVLAGWVSDAFKLYSEGNYAAAMGLAIYIVDDIEERLLLATNMPPACIVKRLQWLLSYTMLRGAPSLNAILSLSYLEHAGNDLKRVLGDEDIIASLALSGIAWSLNSLIITVLQKPSSINQHAPLKLQKLRRPEDVALKCIGVMVATAALISISAYASYRLLIRFRLKGEEV